MATANVVLEENQATNPDTNINNSAHSEAEKLDSVSENLSPPTPNNKPAGENESERIQDAAENEEPGTSGRF